MKMLPYSLVGALAFLIVSGRVRADPPTGNDAAKNPYAEVDPDGVPLNVTQGSKHAAAGPVQMDAAQKQATANARAHNWLLIEYEQQMQRRDASAVSDRDKSANLYLQLSMGKSLSNLDALQEAPEPSAPPAPLTGESHNGSSGPTLRPEAQSTLLPGAFKPLIAPLASPGFQSAENFSSTLTSNLSATYSGFSTPPDSSNPVTPNPASRAPSRTDLTDLQTPGMVASKDDPAAADGTPDLTLDALPGDTPEEARAREESKTRLVLPLAMDADQLHKQDAAKLKLPAPANAVKKAETATPPPKPIAVNPADQPMPVSAQPEIVPVHGSISNPYDILNR